jgi:hypothetical protein
MPDRSGSSGVREALAAYVRARSQAIAVARRELQIGEGDANALLHIADNPGIRPSEISAHLGITSAGVTALIDRLIDRGIVRRDPDEFDRRVNRITVVVDMETDPWDRLTRFDRDFDAACGDVEVADTEQWTTLLDSLVTTTVGRASR